MVEALGIEWQRKDVRLPKLHVGQSCSDRSPPGFRERVGRDVNRHESRARAPLGERHRPGAAGAYSMCTQAAARPMTCAMIRVSAVTSACNSGPTGTCCLSTVTNTGQSAAAVVDSFSAYWLRPIKRSRTHV